jgi:hypothetical protein
LKNRPIERDSAESKVRKSDIEQPAIMLGNSEALGCAPADGPKRIEVRF